MTNEENDDVHDIAERVVKLEEEVEAGGEALRDAESLARARALLHEWIDEMTGVVVSPGLGRVTVLHGKSRPASIASFELAFRLSKPI
jgi:hypothetical protein